MNSVRREKGVSKMSPHSCLGNDRGVNTWLAGRDCPRPFLAILSLPVPLRCSLGCTGSAAAMSSQEEGVGGDWLASPNSLPLRSLSQKTLAEPCVSLKAFPGEGGLTS